MSRGARVREHVGDECMDFGVSVDLTDGSGVDG
jgi:hypothetical protein